MRGRVCRDVYNLTCQALDHRLVLRLGVVRPCAATEDAAKVLSVLVCGVFPLRGLVQGARVRDSRGWAVTTKVAFGEEFDLFVVCVAGDRARGADSAGCGAGEAEIDCLSDVAHVEGAARELVGQSEGSLAKESILRRDQTIERAHEEGTTTMIAFSGGILCTAELAIM